ncbi:MAG: DUF721 domain-containing protein [Bdellovibrionales bacterium]|nr:DUF721 domain-containing protein [Bdellovibrionales bacterium]
MGYNKRNSHLQSAGLVLQSLLQNSKSDLSDQFLRWKLWKFWKEIVGPTLAANSEPVGFKKGQLYVWVDHSARIQELTFLTDSIISRVNERVGKRWVRKIRFTLDRREVPIDAKEQEGLRDALSRSLPNGDGELPPDR